MWCLVSYVVLRILPWHRIDGAVDPHEREDGIINRKMPPTKLATNNRPMQSTINKLSLDLAIASLRDQTLKYLFLGCKIVLLWNNKQSKSNAFRGQKEICNCNCVWQLKYRTSKVSRKDVLLRRTNIKKILIQHAMIEKIIWRCRKQHLDQDWPWGQNCPHLVLWKSMIVIGDPWWKCYIFLLLFANYVNVI